MKNKYLNILTELVIVLNFQTLLKLSLEIGRNQGIYISMFIITLQ